MYDDVYIMLWLLYIVASSVVKMSLITIVHMENNPFDQILSQLLPQSKVQFLFIIGSI